MNFRCIDESSRVAVEEGRHPLFARPIRPTHPQLTPAIPLATIAATAPEGCDYQVVLSRRYLVLPSCGGKTEQPLIS